MVLPERQASIDQGQVYDVGTILEARHKSEAAWTSSDSSPSWKFYDQIWITLIIVSSFVVFVTLSLIALKPSMLNNVADKPVNHQIFCGTSSTEARRHGCHFDVMSFSWLPPECYDESLVEEFLARKSWKYYMRPNSTAVDNQVPFEDVATGSYEHLFVSWDFHKAHCAYMWRKMHRAILSEKPVDSYINSYLHTKHCTEVLMNRNTELENIEVMIQSKFPTCGY